MNKSACSIPKPMSETIHFPFDDKKAAQVAARLVEKKGGRLEYLHVMKMLYAIDRLALAKWGQPVIGGQYCSMNKGPVISEVLDLINGTLKRPTWSEHLQTSGINLVLRKTAGTDELSRAEADLVDTVFVMLGNRDRWDIVAEMHDEFKELENPGKSSRPIKVEAILKAVGKGSLEITEIAKEAAYYNRIDAALDR